MAGDPAELAYGHCLAVLGDPERAAEAAAAALRRAGRARGLVLAHARHQALLAADDADGADPSTEVADPSDPAAVARALAASRPAAERALLDIRSRTGPDRAALGRAVGASPTVAALRAAEVGEEWDRELDPAMLALLGPADCVDLAALLADTALATVGDLSAAAPTVGAHAAVCELCGDRMRAMASVRTQLGRESEPVPDDVRLAGRVSRRRRPSAAPPSLLGLTGAARARRSLPIATAVAAALVVLAVVLSAWPNNDGDQRVEALTKLPARAASLSLGQPSTEGATATVPLANDAGDEVTWTAQVSVAWAEAQPARGTVARFGRDRLRVRLLDSAPEGDVRAKLTVIGSDGSTLVTELTWTVEREPQIAANITGCTVDVSVVEDGELSALVLHWRDTAEHEAPIPQGANGYTSMLPPSPTPLTWWVTATDARGNTARSADSVLAPAAC